LRFYQKAMDVRMLRHFGLWLVFIESRRGFVMP